jgi:hypothetical protein
MQQRNDLTCVPIVHGGGWVTRETVGRRKARFFGFLSVIWFLVSATASIPFWTSWHESPLLSAEVKWLCGILLILQPVFLTLTILFRIFEKPRKITALKRGM